MTSAHHLRINPQANKQNVFKHVKKQMVASTCFSRFPISTTDFNRWRTRVAIILNAGQLITWTADGIPQIMDTFGNWQDWSAE